MSPWSRHLGVMRRSLTLLFLLLGGLARATPGEVIPLRNLCAVAVTGGVESTGADVPHGAGVRSRTEEAVRRMGLEVVPLGKADPTLPLVRATFRVMEVEPGTYAYLFELSLQEPCRIPRNGVTTFCTTWKRQILGSAQGESGMLAALDGALRDLEDDLQAARR